MDCLLVDGVPHRVFETQWAGQGWVSVICGRGARASCAHTVPTWWFNDGNGVVCHTGGHVYAHGSKRDGQE